MSDYTSNTTVNLQVNGQQAAETLANLRKRAADLQNEIAKTAAAGDKVQLKKLRHGTRRHGKSGCSSQPSMIV